MAWQGTQTGRLKKRGVLMFAAQAHQDASEVGVRQDDGASVFAWGHLAPIICGLEQIN